MSPKAQGADGQPGGGGKKEGMLQSSCSTRGKSRIRSLSEITKERTKCLLESCVKYYITKRTTERGPLRGYKDLGREAWSAFGRGSCQYRLCNEDVEAA